MSTPPAAEYVAALDLGSNSFHMVIARVVERQLHIVDRLKEPVRLAAGLDSNRRLTEEAQLRGLASLRKFAERLRAVDNARIRAVGTNTLRKARNARDFLGRAREVLGHRIEIVSGREEARLVYLGVAHAVSDDGGRRLVADIGGGSTEVILGEGYEPLEADSLYMGCVSWSMAHFRDGGVTAKRRDKAILRARQELEPIRRQYQDVGWDSAVGSSGTIAAIDEILRSLGYSAITPKGLRKLWKRLIKAGSVEAASLEGLKPGRAPVLAGGLAILTALVEELDVKQMTVSSGAMREGLLWDLVGRLHAEDRRDTTIRMMKLRYHVDRTHTARVERTVRLLFEHARRGWDLSHPLASRLLVWGARLHEVGKAITYSGYHRHGAYLVTHSDMPGFTRDDQEALAALVRSHRRKIPKQVFRDLGTRQELLLRLCALLRLAVLLNRGRGDRRISDLGLNANGSRIELLLPPGWLGAHPLTRTDLEQEAIYLKKVGFELIADDSGRR